VTPLFRAFRALLSRRRFERDMREELATHIEHRTDDLVASGLSREQARRQARVEFGAVEAYRSSAAMRAASSRCARCTGSVAT